MKDCTITFIGTKLLKFQASLIIPHYLLGQLKVGQLTNKQYTTNYSYYIGLRVNMFIL